MGNINRIKNGDFKGCLCQEIRCNGDSCDGICLEGICSKLICDDNDHDELGQRLHDHYASNDICCGIRNIDNNPI